MRSAFHLFVLLITLLACDDGDGTVGADASADGGGDDTGSGSDATPPTLEEALAQTSASLCQSVARCAPAFVELTFADDLEACAAREVETLAPVFDQPGVTVTAAQLLACEAAFNALSCDDLLKFLLGNLAAPAECLHSGTRPDGEACVHAYQCQSGWCARPPLQACGICVTPKAAGMMCANTSECGPGSHCLEGVCVAYGAIGEPCNPSAPCFPHLTCAEETCAAAVPEGEACTALTGQCDLWGAELVCDTRSRSCITLRTAPPGAPCGLLPEGPTVCSGATCFPNQLMGTCVAPAPDGAACNTTTGPGCLFHAECRDGTCVQPFAGSCP